MFKDAAHYKEGAATIDQIVVAIQDKHGLSLREIAKKIGIGFSTLRDLMRGRSTHNYPTQYILEGLLASPTQENAMKIRSLAELLEILQNAPSDDYDNDELIEYANRYDLRVAHGEIDYSDLPKFGGAEPNGTTEIWSWDTDSLLVGRSVNDFEIVPRQN